MPIGILPGPDKIVVKPGRQAFLHCEVYGNPRPQVSWSRNSQPIISNGHFEMFSNGTLLIRRAEETDVDSYTCVADNGVSQRASRTIKLVLRGMVKTLLAFCDKLNKQTIVVLNESYCLTEVPTFFSHKKTIQMQTLVPVSMVNISYMYLFPNRSIQRSD